MSCVLCGTCHKVESRTSFSIVKLVESRYLKGPFVYNRLKQLSEEQCLICLLCLNHIRKRKTKKQKQMLPMDHFLVGLMNPEFQTNLDTRSKKRIALVLKEKNNFFSHSALAPLNLLIKSHNPISDWWNLNLNTLFFKGSKTSRYIRINIKNEKIMI